MPDPSWWDNTHGGYVRGEPNHSTPVPSRLHPGYEVALHRYPDSGDIWIWRRKPGELWRPDRPATDADISAFRRLGAVNQ